MERAKMEDYTYDSSSRRNFLKTAALAGVGLAPVLRTHKFLGDVSRPFEKKTSSPYLDPKGKVRIGLIGLTGRPGLILNAIPNIHGARLVAFALSDGQRLPREFQRERERTSNESERSGVRAFPAFHRKTRIYETFQEMFVKEDLDVVASCLPNGLNAHASIAAARKGCHIISEEPLALGSRPLATLESVIDETKVQITTMTELRLCPAVLAVRQAIADGLIGEPFLVFAQKSYRSERDRASFHSKPPVGPIPWRGLDLLDSISYTTGMEIRQASGLVSNKTAPATDFQDNPLLVKFSNGGTGIVSVNSVGAQTGSEHEINRLRATGPNGVIEMMGQRATLLTPNHPPRDLPLPPRVSILESFVALLRGQGPHVMTSEESFRVARVSLIADRAAKEGELLRA